MSYQFATSYPAYSEAKINLGDKQKKVYEAIKSIQNGTKNYVSDKMIAKFLGWEINSITGRRNELVKLNLIEESHKGKDPYSNRTVMFWKIKEKQLKLELV